MANALYPIGKKKLLDADIDMLVDNIKCILVDGADYTYNAAHDFLDDVAGASIVATSPNMAGKSTTGGVFDCDDFAFTAVTGDQSEILIYYKDTGAAATSPLICYVDTSIGGAPVTPSGGNINVTIHASGVFSI